jgi:nitroreductase
MVPPHVLQSLFEAAQWAPSCFNEQPWRYLVATQDEPEDFQTMLGCLVPKNQRWARGAPVLMLSFAKKTFTQSGKPNKWGLHDVGLASENLVIQAMAEGLFVHQMAGYDAEKVRKTYGVPDDFEPAAAIAIGYPAGPEAAPEEFQEAERAPRLRRRLDELFFSELWGKPSEFSVQTVGDTP